MQMKLNAYVCWMRAFAKSSAWQKRVQAREILERASEPRFTEGGQKYTLPFTNSKSAILWFVNIKEFIIKWLPHRITEKKLKFIFKPKLC